jgi:hypothetical protein
MSKSRVRDVSPRYLIPITPHPFTPIHCPSYLYIISHIVLLSHLFCCIGSEMLCSLTYYQYQPMGYFMPCLRGGFPFLPISP